LDIHGASKRLDHMRYLVGKRFIGERKVSH